MTSLEDILEYEKRQNGIGFGGEITKEVLISDIEIDGYLVEMIADYLMEHLNVSA